jgi:hypothetical protein
MGVRTVRPGGLHTLFSVICLKRLTVSRSRHRDCERTAFDDSSQTLLLKNKITISCGVNVPAGSVWNPRRFSGNQR